MHKESWSQRKWGYGEIGRRYGLDCIEPWYGIADTVSKAQELSEKKGIQLLESGSKFEASYTMAFK